MNEILPEARTRAVPDRALAYVLPQQKQAAKRQQHASLVRIERLDTPPPPPAQFNTHRVSRQALQTAAPVVFNLSPALPEDPVLRKQHLEDLMTDIHGSFTFMQVKSDMFDLFPAVPLPLIVVRVFQDSVLDGELSSTRSLPGRRRPSFLSAPGNQSASVTGQIMS